MNENENKVGDSNPPLKEVCKFTKSIYPDLITGYPIEYYNMYKYMTDTLMWLHDSGIIVTFNLYASGKIKPSVGTEVYGFYHTRENKDSAININRNFSYCICIETTKLFNSNHGLTDSCRVTLFSEALSVFKYTAVPKILDWYNNPSKYIAANPKDKTKYSASFKKEIKAENVTAVLLDKDRKASIIFEACPENDGEGGSTGKLNIGLHIADQFIYLPWNKMFEFIHIVIDMNHQLYASTMLSFIGMAPVGIGMEPEYMAKYSKLKNQPKKLSLKDTSYFTIFNKTKTLGDAVKLANSMVTSTIEEKFRKEHDLDDNKK